MEKTQSNNNQRKYNVQQTLDIDLLQENRESTKNLVVEYFLNGTKK